MKPLRSALLGPAPLLFLACSAVSAAPPAAPPTSSSLVMQAAQAATPQSTGARQSGLRFGDPVEDGYRAPFFPGTDYDPEIPRAEELLGQLVGSRMAHHEEIVACFRRWADASPRMQLFEHGRTHEGRVLVHAVIASEARMARLEELRLDHARLADPRGMSESGLEGLIERAPAVAWMGYSIHGDETSGADASLAVAYHLIAARGGDVERILEDVVIVIDPIMNPDGRERILGMVEQSTGYVGSLDYASLARGRWPYGRGNHYLFDMNRDWMPGTQPETRARWSAVLRWNPQLFVDGHEMGSLDTFLFYPQNEPINPDFPTKHIEWQRRYAEGAAAAFDAQGWSYYTREWADGWAPFYSDAWSSLAGATGLLYEQAGIQGSPIRRPSGRILTYREAVHHQAVASLANLGTLAANRESALRDFVANKRRNIAAETPGNERMFVVRPSGHPSREAALIALLSGQGVEVFRTEEALTVQAAISALGVSEDSLQVPVGSLIVPARQPMGPMVRAYLNFDPRMDVEALRREREDLERKGETRIYDLTSWSLPHALALDAWWCDAQERANGWGAPLVAATPDAPLLTDMTGGGAAVGWLVDGHDDAAVRFAAQAMEADLAVSFADEVVGLGTRRLARGTLLVRRDENEGTPAALQARVLSAATNAGVREVVAAGTGLAPADGPDFGGGHFRLLRRPRIGIVTHAPVTEDLFGHLWHHLDIELGLPVSLLDAQSLGAYDLRRFNVLVLPPAGGSLHSLLEDQQESLEAWVQRGGTLIACGSSAAALTAEGLGLSEVVLRRDALDDLEPFATAAEREWSARDVQIDEALVWGDPRSAPPEEEADPEEPNDEEEEAPSEDEDAWLRRFSPYGVTLRALIDDRHWLTSGSGDELPVYFSGGRVLLSREPVETPVRMAPEERLRLAGLVWPEARERIATSAWLTVESMGHGQVILFAAMPAFRGYHAATARCFSNAVVLGPGLGADGPIGW